MLLDYAKQNCLTVMTAKDGDTSQTGKTGFRFIPGINEVSGDRWKEMKDHPKIKRLMRAEELKVVAAVEGTDEKSVMSQLKEQQLQAVVKRTFNEKLLETWLETDTRPVVVKAIRQQIKLIQESTAPLQAKSEDF